MYFGRGSYDPAASSEAQSRLQQFQGATAISSNAYFGRPEEDDDDEYHGGGGGDGMLGLEGNETLQNVERNVRDMASRVMADPNVQQLGDQIRAGALRVSRGCGRPHARTCKMQHRTVLTPALRLPRVPRVAVIQVPLHHSCRLGH
jgi:ADP-ribosylation factor GTPase-activating protein 2/3